MDTRACTQDCSGRGRLWPCRRDRITAIFLLRQCVRVGRRPRRRCRSAPRFLPICSSQPVTPIGEMRVSKYMVSRRKLPSETWRTFLDAKTLCLRKYLEGSLNEGSFNEDRKWCSVLSAPLFVVCWFNFRTVFESEPGITETSRPPAY